MQFVIWSLILFIWSLYEPSWSLYGYYGHLFFRMLKFGKKKLIIRTTIATHNSELDCQYLRGKYSIVKNLPTPAVIEIDNHSYCSVKQCIADFVGKG